MIRCCHPAAKPKPNRMKTPHFREYKTATATKIVPGAKIRLVHRTMYVGEDVVFSVAAGNSIWANGTREEMEAFFANATA